MTSINLTFMSEDGSQMDAEVERDITVESLIERLIEAGFVPPPSENTFYTLNTANFSFHGSDKKLSEFELKEREVISVLHTQTGGGQKLPQKTYSAPIEIPDNHDLTVQLVPINTLDRLEEYRSDQTRWESAMWAFIGAVLGVIVNWVTSPSIVITSTSLVLIGVFVVMILITGFAARDFKKRAEKVKGSILTIEKPPKTKSGLTKRAADGRDSSR